jgi:hypothetical protein
MKAIREELAASGTDPDVDDHEAGDGACHEP